METKINIKEALTLINEDKAILIDVREKEDFQREHITYAISIPRSNFENNFKSLKLPEQKTVIVQCSEGVSSESVCNSLRVMKDFNNKIFNMEGGITAWKKEGYPVVSCSKNNSISIFRQVQIIMGSLISFLIVIGFLGFKIAFVLAGLLSLGLAFSGITGVCGLAKLLNKMPWNK